MKALCLYCHMVLFVFHNFTNGEIWKFGRDLLLVKFGSKRVKFTEVCMVGDINLPPFPRIPTTIQTTVNFRNFAELYPRSLETNHFQIWQFY